MDPKDIRTLKLLEEIDNDYVPSQRDLARSLNISLGLVNSFIKRLAHKGYFKITTIPKNRVKYILTPKGAAEKTRLTYEFIQYSFEFYRTSRQKLRNLFQELVAQNVRRIVFYGATDLTEIAYLSLQETPIQLVAILDADKAGSSFLGFKIEHPKRLPEFSYDRLLFTDEEPDDEFFRKINKEKMVLIR